jgi:steroid delta-isomerase
MSEAQMKAVLEAYIAGLNARDADAVLALFAPDAEIEDPVGTPVRRGPELDAWFRGAVQVEPHLELEAPIRASHGRSAAMAFTVATRRKNGRFLTRSIDVVHFDDQGRIQRLEGYWGPEDRSRVGDA